MEFSRFFYINSFQTCYNPGSVCEIDDQFKVRSMISDSTEKSIYLAENSSRDVFCVKMSNKQVFNSLIWNERDILMRLQSQSQIPKLFSSGYYNGMAYIVTEQLGQNLEQFQYNFSPNKNITEAKQITILCLQALSQLHSLGIIHGDVKPSNFITGKYYPITMIKLIDFETAFHAQSTEVSTSRLTPDYCSRNQQEGKRPTFSDDLESLLYTLIYVYTGTLPWNTLQIIENHAHAREVFRKKERITVDKLYNNLPGRRIFIKMHEYKERLFPGQIPDYQYLLKLARKLPQKDQPSEIINRRDFIRHHYTTSLNKTIILDRKKQRNKKVQANKPKEKVSFKI